MSRINVEYGDYVVVKTNVFTRKSILDMLGSIDAVEPDKEKPFVVKLLNPESPYNIRCGDDDLLVPTEEQFLELTEKYQESPRAAITLLRTLVKELPGAEAPTIEGEWVDEVLDTDQGKALIVNLAPEKEDQAETPKANKVEEAPVEIKPSLIGFDDLKEEYEKLQEVKEAPAVKPEEGMTSFDDADFASLVASMPPEKETVRAGGSNASPVKETITLTSNEVEALLDDEAVYNRPQLTAKDLVQTCSAEFGKGWRVVLYSRIGKQRDFTIANFVVIGPNGVYFNNHVNESMREKGSFYLKLNCIIPRELISALHVKVEELLKRNKVVDVVTADEIREAVKANMAYFQQKR